MITRGLDLNPTPEREAELIAKAAADMETEYKELKVSEQKPSIGRTVFYQRHGSPNGQHKSEPSPAVVTAIADDGSLSLFVMNPNGFYFNHGTKFDADGGPGTWRWPPRV